MDKYAVEEMKRLVELETIAQEVLIDNQEIISLDKQRNANREALRALKDSIKNDQRKKSLNCAGSVPILHNTESRRYTWSCIGDMFIQLPKEQLIESIELGASSVSIFWCILPVIS